MKIIISPAKKMNVDTDSLPAAGLPVLLHQTRILRDGISKMSYDEVKKLWGCNDQLAGLNYKRFADMDLEHNLTPAVLAYEGLQYPRPGHPARLRFWNRLTSTFRWLRPVDGWS